MSFQFLSSFQCPLMSFNNKISRVTLRRASDSFREELSGIGLYWDGMQYYMKYIFESPQAMLRLRKAGFYFYN